LYAEMRNEAPVYEGVGPVTGRSSWFLTRYEDVVAAFNDRRLGRDIERLPEPLRDQHRFRNEDILAVINTHMLNMDPPDHTRLRRLVSSTFTPKRVRELTLAHRSDGR
jgi:cytochrome P450